MTWKERKVRGGNLWRICACRAICLCEANRLDHRDIRIAGNSLLQKSRWKRGKWFIAQVAGFSLPRVSSNARNSISTAPSLQQFLIEIFLNFNYRVSSASQASLAHFHPALMGIGFGFVPHNSAHMKIFHFNGKHFYWVILYFPSLLSKSITDRNMRNFGTNARSCHDQMPLYCILTSLFTDVMKLLIVFRIFRLRDFRWPLRFSISQQVIKTAFN
jgi:hypothetical protein